MENPFSTATRYLNGKKDVSYSSFSTYISYMMMGKPNALVLTEYPKEYRNATMR
uniref:Uncharacterized protein n=1 Tax=Rhizophora mucronata TaxID=61149 RepID=A0A2P2NBR4_RHIMU